MINLYKGNNTNSIYCTPSESTDDAITFYYFNFVNRITKESVEMWLENLSTTARYQMFIIATDDYFLNSNGGLWSYTIQASEENIVPTSEILESGLMYLHSTNVAPVKYNEQINTFKTYNG